MYALVDCNNFYASCERIFQPKLEGKPIVVLSNNDGCVIARSDEARALGIQMAAPAHELEAFFEEHKVHVFSSNYELYGDMSARVMNTLGTFTPSLEVYSIDEAFLDLGNLAFTGLPAYAITIRKTVKQHTGIPTCVGIAPSKTLAKAANRYARKKTGTGTFVMDTEQKRYEVLNWLDIKGVWGIGRKLSRWLESNGITTAWQLATADRNLVRTKMGVVGLRLYKELNGISCIDMENAPPAKQQICTSRSFPVVLDDEELVRQSVATHTTRCAEKLRRQKARAGMIYVYIITNTSRTYHKQYHGALAIPILTPTNSTPELIMYAMKALDRIFRTGYKYKKTGVILSEIRPEEQMQLSIFDKTDHARSQKLMKAVDGINALLGQDKVRFATAGYGRGWALKAEKKSPCYTTNIKEILKVKI